MSEYALYTDATCDIPAKYAEKYQINVLPMKISLSGQTLVYANDWKSEQYSEFYDRLRGGDVASTTQITPFEYEEAFRKTLANDADILYICFSSGMSATIQSARLAANNLSEEFPQRTVRIVDSLTVTVGLGLLMLEAGKNRENGMSIEENAAAIENIIANGYAQWFTVDSLTYLARGGRLNTVSAIMGSALQIKPVLEVYNGKLVTRQNVQGRKSSIRALVKNAAEIAAGRKISRIFITHADAYDMARLLESQLKSAVDAGEIICDTNVSPIIGSHVGPGLVAMFFL